MPDGLLIFLLLLIVGCTISWIFVNGHDEKLKQKALEHMKGRPSLTDSGFGRRFYDGDVAAAAARVRKVLSNVIRYDTAQVIATDRLEDDLKLGALDSLGYLDLLFRLEKEFGVKIARSECEKLRSVDDVVQLLVRLSPPTVDVDHP